MQLFTVIYHLKRMISKFDSHGRKIEDIEVLVEHRQHDLPFQTAQMYMKTDTNGTCRVETQAPSFQDPKGRRTDYVGFSDLQSKPSNRYADRSGVAHFSKSKTAKAAPTTKKPADTFNHAAASGDMAAAINASK